MDAEKFKAIYSEGRNGANCFYNHWANRRFQYSDGVKDLAEQGLYWLLDIGATEWGQKLQVGDLGVVTFKVPESGTATLEMSTSDDAPPVWSRDIHITDCPAGEWIFYVVDEGERIAMILPTEY